MKLKRIELGHFLAATEIDIKVEKPIVLIASHNGMGKSSVRDAIAMAFTRETPRGIDLKKNLGQLINDNGSKAGGAVITCAGDPDTDDQAFGFALPKGTFTGPELPDAMKVAIDGQRFSAMSVAERRTFLFALTGRRATTAYVKAALEATKCDPKLIEEVLPTLRTGINDACEYAKDKAKASKTLWNSTTGATWGSKIADGWEAPLPDVPAGDAAALKALVQTLDAAISAQTEELGGMRQAATKAASDATRRAQLEAAVARLPELEKLLPTAIAERDAYQKKVDDLRTRAAGKARVGLVHDMARFIDQLRAAITTKEAVTRQAELLLAYAKEHGDIGTATTPDPEAVSSLPEHEKGMQVLINRATNLHRDLDAAKAAKAQHDVLAPAVTATDASADIAEVEKVLAEAKAERQRVMNQALDIEAAQAKRDAAAGKTKTAAAHHANVAAWLAIADQLAPAGIPATLLKEALKPVNDALYQASLDSTWPRVRIDEDMSITMERTAGKPRLYQLESASYRWRADAMIAQVVATMSGLKVLVLDAVDLLMPSARPELFSWVDMLVDPEVGELDSVVLLAALQRPPENLLSTFQLAWLSDGNVVQQQEQAAA